MAGDTKRAQPVGAQLLNPMQEKFVEAGNTEMLYNALVEASKNPLIDAYSRAQFSRAAAESSATNLSAMARTLAMETKAAVAGEGIYGIRRKNEELAKLLLEKPGSKQTLLSINNPNQPGSVTQTNLLGGQ